MAFNISALTVFITAVAYSSFTSFDVSLALFIKSSNSPVMAMMGRVRLKSKIIAFSMSMRMATLLGLANGFFNVKNEVHQER
ncbi:hypothetical protein AMTRI_Chr06g170360 [Amborella trichopoda]